MSIGTVLEEMQDGSKLIVLRGHLDSGGNLKGHFEFCGADLESSGKGTFAELIIKKLSYIQNFWGADNEDSKYEVASNGSVDLAKGFASVNYTIRRKD